MTYFFGTTEIRGNVLSEEWKLRVIFIDPNLISTAYYDENQFTSLSCSFNDSQAGCNGLHLSSGYLTEGG